jgi:hypothetical protein
MKRKILAALGLLAVVSTAAIGAGMFQGYPTVGGAATCVNFATNPTTGAVLTTCNGPTVPAGPTGLTGNELVPSDTQLTQGQTPATVLVPVTSLASGSWTNPTAITGGSVTIPNGITNYVLRPAGTLSSLTITMPSAPKEGQLLRISSSQTITTLTLSGAGGQTISNAPTALTISTTGSYGYAFIWSAVQATWYRVQ